MKICIFKNNSGAMYIHDSFPNFTAIYSYFVRFPPSSSSVESASSLRIANTSLGEPSLDTGPWVAATAKGRSFLRSEGGKKHSMDKPHMLKSTSSMIQVSSILVLVESAVDSPVRSKLTTVRPSCAIRIPSTCR